MKGEKIMETAEHRALAKIAIRAAAGQRAPFNSEIIGGSGVISNLVIDGLIRVEIYPHNWRVIEIHKTKARTLEPPNKKWKPYKILDGRHNI